MSNALIKKVCVPCRGGIPPLTTSEAKTFLLSTVGWELKEDAKKLHRSFKFDDFQMALDFVQKVAAVAEQEDHHPDIEFGWGYANISVLTHKINGLHENDFILAAKINLIQE
ncbi:MAG TPA: 4a-hydroxytetrahydrobiopterin dehydratase [Rhodospirillales bacterium]|jgi:4a-hydroxytetrahydrobiopterin dehydratase|nr:4a-hydroxytetrahydrobiopterin dehydratase [Rhodospirillales bacterium]HIL75625.1 4a-hydroxytetrahydrobiopterin dehydratase [Rhodospirillales bacterium]